MIKPEYIQEQAAGSVIQNDKQQILLIMRNDMPLWECVGGIVEPGETYEQALARETLEEICCEIKIGNYIGGHYRKLDTNKYRQALFYKAELVTHKIELLDGHVAFEWFDKDRLPYNIPPLHRLTIEKMQENKELFEVTDSVPNMLDFSRTLKLEQIYGAEIWRDHPVVMERRQKNTLRYDPFAA